MREGLSAEEVLRRDGLSPEPKLELDAPNGVTLTRWVRI